MRFMLSCQVNYLACSEKSVRCREQRVASMTTCTRPQREKRRPRQGLVMVSAKGRRSLPCSVGGHVSPQQLGGAPGSPLTQGACIHYSDDGDGVAAAWQNTCDDVGRL
uniref:Uncharacterized protein n=1 Tax=Arundo donax TaxID=35708 RepID=A0A0A9GAN2_ARUDO